MQSAFYSKNPNLLKLDIYELHPFWPASEKITLKTTCLEGFSFKNADRMSKLNINNYFRM
jgi:hypothetical protein